MRLKIIAGNLGVVLLVGLVSFFVVQSRLERGLTHEIDGRLSRDQVLFDRSWQLSALRFREHVQQQAATRSVRLVYSALDEQTRRRVAYEAAERVAEWFQDPARGWREAPDIVLITDEAGQVIARNKDINRMHGERLLKTVPSMRAVLSDNELKHDVWFKADEDKLLQVAIAPIRGPGDATLGALLVGYDLSNGLARSESRILGRAVAFITDKKVYSSSLPGSAVDPLRAFLFGTMVNGTRDALASKDASSIWATELGGSDYVGVTAPLPMVRSNKVAYVLLANRSKAVELRQVAYVILLLTILGATFALLYGFRLGSSFLRVVERMEEGILAVINGRTDVRLSTEDDDLGGLAYRINQLINGFTGVVEREEGHDDTNASASAIASGGGLEDWSGFTVIRGQPPKEEPGAAGSPPPIDDPALAAELAKEPEATYYERLFRSYLQAKAQIGEDLSGLNRERFETKLKKDAQSVAEQHGCRMVRFRVELVGNEVKLRPVLIRQ